MAPNIKELPVEQLRHTCDPAIFHFRSTEELEPLEEIIGQDRAVRAVAFGIDIRDHGYHMYALGPVGTGKTTTIMKYLMRDAPDRPVPDDWLYVNNFADPDKPRALRLPSGVGCKLKDDMDKLVEELSSDVPRVFESSEYSKQEEQLGEELEKRQQGLLDEVNEYAERHGLTLMQTPQGLIIAPVIHGKVATPEQIEQMSEETQHEIETAQADVQTRLRDAMRAAQQMQREARDRTNELDRKAVAGVVDHFIDELKERYKTYATVVQLLDEIRANIVENVPAFKQIRQVEQMKTAQLPFAAMLGRELPSFDEYKVNLIVNNCGQEGAPVILARNPSYHNLIGRVEHMGQFGTLVTNFNMIKSGLLHKANGGYLVISVRDLLTKPLAYEGLMRALKNRVIEIESLAEAYGLFATRTLEPEPIPLDLKVVLIGEPQLYYLLFAYDPDFREMFKVKVDFALRAERTPDSVQQYAHFIGTVCQEEGLKQFDPSGVARVVEHGSRLVEHQRYLLTKFGDIVDLIRQASYWAGKNGHELVTAADVDRALEEHVYRSNQIQQRIQEAIAENTLLIDIEGSYTGQGNGLAVLSLGDYAFGKPSRITALVHVGGKGVMNIDREVKLGGPIHNKGSFILAAYLGAKYATDVPLALSATITFEQEYEEIEGDSASSMELYTLISALSGIPIRQDIAVTGSVNQHGHVQAIGGVNEKIEGYFDVCHAKGITGSQGVMIPESNMKHLMLRQDVVDAVRDGKFHIYAVRSIDEGLEVLTGQEAGACRADGSYPEGTVNGAAHARLRGLAMKVRDFMKPEEPAGSEEEEPPMAA